MRRLAAFLRLPGPERAMAVEAAVCLALARAAVRHVPMRHWRGLVNAAVRDAPGPARRLALGRAAGRMVRRVARRLPFETACLPRAMAAQWMLRRRGVPSRLVFGARRPAAPGGCNDYHAWLTVDGERVVGGRRAETYRPLPALSPVAAGASRDGAGRR